MKISRKNRTIIGIIAIAVLIAVFTIFDIDFQPDYDIEPFYFDNQEVLFDTTLAYKDSIFHLYKEDTTKLEPNTFKSFSFPTYKCLSCHDGSTASDKGHWGGGPTRSHPVGVYYDAFQNDELNDPHTQLTNGNTIEDLLENGYVGCTSCHLKHDKDNKANLVMSNKNSQLCLVCHIK